MYNRRYLHDYLSLRPTDFRAILITGPRRSGKSTFAAELLRDWGGGSALSFDTPLEQARFAADPEGFLRSLKTPALLDEVQNVPEIFSYLKKLIDEKPGQPCDYILTGSQQFQMMNRVTESLAGRVLVKELLPFAVGEVSQTPVSEIKLNLETLLQGGTEFITPPSIRTHLLAQGGIVQCIATGGFPPAVLAADEERRIEWFNSYVETYVQRDVRALSSIQNLSSFSRFVSLVAGRTAQLINYSELGKDIGVNYKTAQHYLSLLEASYLWKSLPPYYKVGSEKRLSRSSKGIFCDTGLAMFLIGLTAQGLPRNPSFGAFFETLAITEIVKLCAAMGKRVHPLHFRAGETAEVDLVLEVGNRLIPIEIKCSASPDASWGRGIKIFRQVTGIADQPGYVISLCPEIRPLATNTFNLPVNCLF